MAGETPSAKELYDHTAPGWVRRTPTSLSDFTGRPPTLALCEPVRGTRVLDLGCGEGYCARQLRAAGAERVVGVDVSAAMVDAARRQESIEPAGIEYRVGEATDLSWAADGAFDRVLAMFLFNYLTLAQTAACMREVRRVLAPGGRFVFAAPHPLLPFARAPEPPFYFQVGQSGYFTARDARFPGRIWKRDGTALDVQLCHKTLQDYFDALRDAGFTAMPLVRELGVTPEILRVDPAFFGPLRECPLHLAVSVAR